jgi:uroporphyrinogen-III synthase
MSRIVVTRPAEDAAPLVERLERLGHEVALCPLIRVEPLGDDPVDVSAYDWVVVTSRNGARELARRRAGRMHRLAAIGPGTAAELSSRGMSPDLVPEVSTQEGLLAALPRPVGRVLFAGALDARRLLVETLGAEFSPLYRTVALAPERFPEADLVVLASASAARAYARVSRGAPAVSIGPETTKVARAAGVLVAGEARTHDVDGLVEAIRAASE